ncbi:MAG: HNH endonuclease, partial [Raoultibacter sp.]
TRAYNRNRDRRYTNFYKTKAWQNVSKAKLADAGYRCECEDCHAIATEVHHKVPIQTEEGWDLRLDWDYLMAVCVRCHNKLHKRF